MENKYKNIPYVLGAVLFVLAFMHFNRSNYAENTRYKQGLVDGYDSFYSECESYFTENNLLIMDALRSKFKQEIQEDIALEKEAKLFDGETTYDTRLINALCKELEEFSKEESKEVIHDIFYPEKEHITKDCDGRVCVYSN